MSDDLKSAIEALMNVHLDDDFGVPESVWTSLGHEGSGERCTRCNCIPTGVMAWNKCTADDTELDWTEPEDNPAIGEPSNN